MDDSSASSADFEENPFYEEVHMEDSENDDMLLESQIRTWGVRKLVKEFSLEQLQAFAVRHGIDVSSAAQKKKDLVKRLKAWDKEGGTYSRNQEAECEGGCTSVSRTMDDSSASSAAFEENHFFEEVDMKDSENDDMPLESQIRTRGLKKLVKGFSLEQLQVFANKHGIDVSSVAENKKDIVKLLKAWDKAGGTPSRHQEAERKHIERMNRVNADQERAEQEREFKEAQEEKRRRALPDVELSSSLLSESQIGARNLNAEAESQRSAPALQSTVTRFYILCPNLPEGVRLTFQMDHPLLSSNERAALLPLSPMELRGTGVVWHSQLEVPVGIQKLSNCFVYAVFERWRVSEMIPIHPHHGIPFFQSVSPCPLPPLRRSPASGKGVISSLTDAWNKLFGGDRDYWFPSWKRTSISDPIHGFIEASILRDHPIDALILLDQPYQHHRLDSRHAVMLLNALSPVFPLPKRGLLFIVQSCRDSVFSLDRPLYIFSPHVDSAQHHLLCQSPETISSTKYGEFALSTGLASVALKLAPTLAHALHVVSKHKDLIPTFCKRNWSRAQGKRVDVDVLLILMGEFQRDKSVLRAAAHCAVSKAEYFSPQLHDASFVLAIFKVFLQEETGAKLADHALRWLTNTARDAPSSSGVASAASDLDLLAAIGASNAVSPDRVSTAAARWLTQRILSSSSSQRWYWRNQSPHEVLASQLRTCHSLATCLVTRGEDDPSNSTISTMLTASVGSFLSDLSDEHLVKHGHVAWSVRDEQPSNAAAQAAQERVKEAFKTLVESKNLAQASQFISEWGKVQPPEEFVLLLCNKAHFDATQPLSTFFLAPDGFIESLSKLLSKQEFAALSESTCNALSSLQELVPRRELERLLLQAEQRSQHLDSRAKLLGRNDFLTQVQECRCQIAQIDNVADVCRFLANRGGDAMAVAAVDEAENRDYSLSQMRSLLPEFQRILALKTTPRQLNLLLQHSGWWRTETPPSLSNLLDELLAAEDRWHELRSHGVNLLARTVLDLFGNEADVGSLFTLDIHDTSHRGQPSLQVLEALKSPFRVARASRLLPALFRLPQRLGAPDDSVMDRGANIPSSRLKSHADRLRDTDSWHEESCGSLQDFLTGDVKAALEPLGGPSGEIALMWLAGDDKAEILLNFLNKHPDRGAFDNLKDLVDGDDVDQAIESIQRAWETTHKLLRLAQNPQSKWVDLLREIAAVAKHPSLVPDLKQAADFVPEVQNIMQKLNEETGARAMEDFDNVWRGPDVLQVSASGEFSIGNRSSSHLRDLRNRLVLSGRSSSSGNDNTLEEAGVFVQLITDVEGVAASLLGLYQSGHPDYDRGRIIEFGKPLRPDLIRKRDAELRNELTAFHEELEECSRKYFHLNLLPLEYLRPLANLISDFENTSKVLRDDQLQTALRIFLRLKQLDWQTDLPLALAVSGGESQIASKVQRVGIFLQSLAESLHSMLLSRRRLKNLPKSNLLRGFQAGKPLMLTTNATDILPLTVVLYGGEGRTPEVDELLICRSSTTFHEVRAMIQRSILNLDDSDASSMMIIAGIHLLSDAVQEEVVRWLHAGELLLEENAAVDTSSLCSRRLIFICEERQSATGMLPGALRTFSQNIELDQELRQSARLLLHEMISVHNVEVLNAKVGCYGKTHHAEREAKLASAELAVIQVTRNIGPARMIQMLERSLNLPSDATSTARDPLPIHIKLAPGVDLEQFGMIAFELLILGVLVSPNKLFAAREQLTGRHIFLELPNFNILQERHLLALFPCPNFIDSPRNLRLDDDWQLVAGVLHMTSNGVRQLRNEFLSVELFTERSPPDDKVISQLVQANMGAYNASFLQQVVFVRFVASALRGFFEAVHLSGSFDNHDRQIVQQRRGDVVEMICDAGRELIRRAHYNDRGRVEFADTQLWSSCTPFLVMATSHGIIPIMRRSGQKPDSVKRLLQSDGSRGVDAIDFMHLRGVDELLGNLLRALGRPSDVSSEFGQRVKQRIKKLKFSLTRENCLKAVAIYARLNAHIPVVLCGATGIGKTALVQFLAKLLHVKLYSMTIHGGTTERRLEKWILEKSRDAMKRQNKQCWIFLDECNAAPITAAVKLVVCDHRVPSGARLPKHVHVIAALNPYLDRSKRDSQVEVGVAAHSTDSHHVHFSSARMHHGSSRQSSVFELDADEDDDNDYDIALERSMDEGDMANLVYRVAPVPPSLNELVWDFGDLSPEDEEIFVHRMIIDEIVPHLYKEMCDGILEAHSFIREHCKNEPALVVSLRDVKRCASIFKCLNLDLLPKINPASRIPHRLRTIFHTLMTAYVSRLDTIRRADLLQRLAQRLEVCVQDMHDCVEEDREIFAQQMLQDMTGIAQNNALEENLFVLTTCIMARIPILLVGRPGSSKTLAIRIIEDKLRALRTQRPFDLPAVEITSYQCSPLSTGQSILGAANRVAAAVKRQRQEGGARDRRFVLLLDEVGLAEESPFMPLKVLHELLERNDEFSIVGISNWALDPAKMNRALFLNRGTPDENDLCETARSLAESVLPGEHTFELKPEWRRALARGFNKSCEGHPENFFGLRDFYSLIKVFVERRQHHGSNSVDALEYAVARAFGGLQNRAQHARNSFAAESPLAEVHLKPRKSVELIRDNLVSSNSRHMLIISPDEDSALDLLTELNLLSTRDGVEFEPFIGSEFDDDISATAIAVDIGRIKHCVEAGVPIVLLRGDALFEALYDLLNQHYVRRGEKLYAQLALGAERRMCSVHPGFKCIVLMGERIVADGKVPPPLLNRFEKVYLSQSDVLDSRAQRVLEEVQHRLSVLLARSEISDSFNDPKFVRLCKKIFVGFAPDNVQSLVRKHVLTKDLESTAVEETLKDLLLTALPEAILSLPPSTDADWARNIYFTQQELDHMNFREALDRMRGQEARCHLVFTFSAPIVLRELVPQQVRILDLDAYPTEALFRSAVTRQLISVDEDGLVIVQCRFQERARQLDTDGGSNVMIRTGRLLSQVQYVLDTEVKALKSARQVVLVIHLLPGAHRLDHFFCRHGGRWTASTISDLEAGFEHVDPLFGLPQLHNVKGRSRSSLVDASGLCTLLLAGELRLAVNKVRYPRVVGMTPELRLTTLTSILRRPETRKILLGAIQRAMELRDPKDSSTESWLREALSMDSIESVGSARRSVGLAVLKLLRESTQDALLLLDQNLNLLSLKAEDSELDRIFGDLVCIMFGAIEPKGEVKEASLFERFPWPRRLHSIACGRGQAFVPNFPFSAVLYDAMRNQQNLPLEGDGDVSFRIQEYAHVKNVSARAIAFFAGDLGMLLGLPIVGATVPASQAVALGSATLAEATQRILQSQEFLQGLLGVCLAHPELEPDLVEALMQPNWSQQIGGVLARHLTIIVNAVHTVVGNQTLGNVLRMVTSIAPSLDQRISDDEDNTSTSLESYHSSSLFNLCIGIQLYRSFVSSLFWSVQPICPNALAKVKDLLLNCNFGSLTNSLNPIKRICADFGYHQGLKCFLPAYLLTLNEVGFLQNDDLGNAMMLLSFATCKEVRESCASAEVFALAVRNIVAASQNSIDDLVECFTEIEGLRAGPRLSHELILTLRAIHANVSLEDPENWASELRSWNDNAINTTKSWESVVRYGRVMAAIDCLIDQTDNLEEAACNQVLRASLRQNPYLHLRALRALLRKCGGSATSLCRLWKSKVGWVADISILEEQAHPIAVLESELGALDRARRELGVKLRCDEQQEQIDPANSLADLVLAAALELWNVDDAIEISTDALRPILAGYPDSALFTWAGSMPNLKQVLGMNIAFSFCGLMSAITASGQSNSWLVALLAQQNLALDNLYFVTMDDDENDAVAAALRQVPGITVWRCQNGHPYGIDGCGQPMQTGTCPRCGVQIGGVDHAAVGTTHRDGGTVSQFPAGYIYRQDIQRDARCAVRALPAFQFRIVRFVLHSLFLARACAGYSVPRGVVGDAINFFCQRLDEDFSALQNLLGAYDLRSQDSVRDILFCVARRLRLEASMAPALGTSPDVRLQQETWMRAHILDPLVAQDGAAPGVALRSTLDSLRLQRSESSAFSAGLRRVLGEKTGSKNDDVFSPPPCLRELSWWSDDIELEPIPAGTLNWARVSDAIALQSTPAGHRSQIPTKVDASDNEEAAGVQILEENRAVPFPLLRIVADDMVGQGRDGHPRLEAVDHLYNLLDWRQAGVSRFSGYLIEGRRDLSVRKILQRPMYADMEDSFRRFRESWTALAGGALPHVRAQCRQIATADFPIVTDDLSVVDTIATPAEGNDIGLPEVLYMATKTLAESYNELLSLGSALLSPETAMDQDSNSCEFGPPLPQIRWFQVAKHRDLLYVRLDDNWLSHPFRRALIFDELRGEFKLQALEQATVGALFEGRARLHTDIHSELESFALLRVHERLNAGDQSAIEELCKRSRSAWDQLYAFAEALVGWISSAAANPDEVILLGGSIRKAYNKSLPLREVVHASQRPWAATLSSTAIEETGNSSNGLPVHWPPITALGVLYAQALCSFAESARAKAQPINDDLPIDVEQVQGLPMEGVISAFLHQKMSQDERHELRRLLNFVFADSSRMKSLILDQMGLLETLTFGGVGFGEALREKIEDLDTETDSKIRACHTNAFRDLLFATIRNATLDNAEGKQQDLGSLSKCEMDDLERQRAIDATVPRCAKKFSKCRKCGHFMEFMGGGMHVVCSDCGSSWYYCCLRSHNKDMKNDDIAHHKDLSCREKRHAVITDREAYQTLATEPR